MALARLKREQLRESLRPRIEQLKSNFVDNLNLFKGKIKELSSDEGLLGDFSLLLEGLLPLLRELELVEDLGETNNNQQRLLNSLAGRANFSWQLPNLLLEFLPHFNLSNSFNFARELETRNSKQWIFRDTRRNFLFKNI